MNDSLINCKWFAGQHKWTLAISELLERLRKEQWFKIMVQRVRQEHEQWEIQSVGESKLFVALFIHSTKLLIKYRVNSQILRRILI